MEPPRNLRRRCRCNFTTLVFWTILFRKISYPFRQIKKLIIKRSEKNKISAETKKKSKIERQVTLKSLVLTWDPQSPGYAFARNCAFSIYETKAQTLTQFAAMKKYEKYLGMLLSRSEDSKHDKEYLSKIPVPSLKLTEEGLISHSNKQAFLDYLMARQRIVNKNFLKIKQLILSSIIKLISLTLLWRALDMKVYFNTELIHNILSPVPEGAPPKPHILAVYFVLYKLCLKNLVIDFVYWWSVLLMLRVDSNLWALCQKKIDSSSHRKILEKGQEITRVSTLDTIDGVLAFDQKKRQLVREYAGYSLNERLEKTLFIIGNIFRYRKEMIQKISNLKRIPQFQNIDNRTANLLIVSIIGKDLLLFSLIALSLAVNPLRIVSFFYYVKNGNFSNNINPLILFDRFQSYA